MSKITIKYSQSMATVVGDPASIAANMAIFKAQESALLEMVGETTNKQSIKPSTTPGQIIDWTVDVHMGSEEEIEEQTKNMQPNRSATQPKPPVTPESLTNAVNASSACGGSGDPSDMLKTTLAQSTQDLLKHIIKSMKSGYDLSSHATGMKKWNTLVSYIRQLDSLIPTAIPDGIGACTLGKNIYELISQVILKTYLKLPSTMSTQDVQQALAQMDVIQSLNEDFNGKIGGIVICIWMKIAPETKLPIAYTNLIIIIKALRQLLNDGATSGNSSKKLDEINALLDTIQL